MLTLNIFKTFSSISIVDFEQVNVSVESDSLKRTWTGHFAQIRKVETALLLDGNLPCKSKFQNHEFNSFHASVPFLYPLKTSENQSFSDVFREYRNGILVQNGLRSGKGFG